MSNRGDGRTSYAKVPMDEQRKGLLDTRSETRVLGVCALGAPDDDREVGRGVGRHAATGQPGAPPVPTDLGYVAGDLLVQVSSLDGIRAEKPWRP